MRDFGCSCTPYGDVSRFLGNAVGFDISEEDEFVVGRHMLDKEAGALVYPRLVLSVADGHVADGDIWENGLVLPIVVEASGDGMKSPVVMENKTHA